MKIGIGHPGTIPGVQGQLILEWARRADANPFSSLGSLDRLVFPNYDSLITLTAAAAVTQRIRSQNRPQAWTRSPVVGLPLGWASAAERTTFRPPLLRSMIGESALRSNWTPCSASGLVNRLPTTSDQ